MLRQGATLAEIGSILRHQHPMGLLQSGVDTTLIAMWLGHESVDTTRVYLEADLAMKEKILAKTMPYDGRPLVYKADDTLMTFLRSL
jgi:integrase/recombinase XerD